MFLYVGSNVFFKASVEFVSVSCLMHSSIYQVFSITTVPEPLSAGFIIISCRCLSWHKTRLAGGLSSRAIVIVSGADPGFDEGGSDNHPPRAVAPTGGPGACSHGKFFILGPLKCDFQGFQGKFEVI